MLKRCNDFSGATTAVVPAAAAVATVVQYREIYDDFYLLLWKTLLLLAAIFKLAHGAGDSYVDLCRLSWCDPRYDIVHACSEHT